MLLEEHEEQITQKLGIYDSSDFQLANFPGEKNLPECLEHLRRLILEDKKLKCPTDDDFLILFIRGKKYNVESAFEAIKCAMKSWSSSLELWTDAYPSAQSAVFTHQGLTIVSKYRSNGRQILIIRVEFWDTYKFDAEDLMISSLMMVYHLVKSSIETNIRGIYFVYFADGLSWRHLRFCTPSRIKKVLTVMQNGLPIRIKGIHVLNNFYMSELAFTLFKPFMGEKLRKRMVFHGRNYKDSLVEALGIDALPRSLGGNVPDEDYELKTFFPDLLTQDEYYKGFLTNELGYKD